MSERRPDLRIDIIAPSSYDDKGNLKQSWKILMRPPVFNIIGGLAYKAASDYGLAISVANYNERIERGNGYLDVIKRDEPSQSSVVFITAKTFEIPRAIDIAIDLQRAGKQVVLGGPGVTLADYKLYQYLVEEGISFNVGEGENTVGQIIQDALNHQLRPAYWQKGFVDMRRAPLPLLTGKSGHNQTVTHQAALDISEGCPFNCSYCGVIKARGRRTSEERSRDVSTCMEWIERTHATGLPIMIIDDNFRMSYAYRKGGLKGSLIYLNEKLERKGRGLYLVTQMDTRPDVVEETEELAAMGVKHVFVGMESLDPLVLAASRKKQNHPELYQSIVDKFHKHGIAVGSGVMIGFPPQTPASIHREMRDFAKLVDIGHPFLVTPVPGTDDYLEAVQKGELRTWDLNFYDSTHSVRNWLEKMSSQEVEAAYRQSYFDLFPIKNLFKPETPSWWEQVKRIAYVRGLAELGNRFYGYPFHCMMDGIPHFPQAPVVRRPADGFTGFALDPEDPAYQDPKSYTEYKEAYLSRIAWSPQDPVFAEV